MSLVLASARLKDCCVGLEKELAGTQGFEPRYAAPEAAVLPLDDVPTLRLF